MKKEIILAIESSCDDTSAAVMKGGTLLSNVIHTQELHKTYGGVVPELASRAHQIKILSTIDQALQQAGISKIDLDAIAFTRGPGLLGSLLVGVTTAKSMALALDIPLIEVHHMHAHVMAHFIEEPKPSFPFLCLTVSGGHTQIIKVMDYDHMEVIGDTIDDAAGEAFDKAGKMLGLEYPAGPEIDKLAKSGSPVFEFNKPQIPGLNFSFSGLKTSILYKLRKLVKEDSNFVADHLEDLCASIQSTIVDILIKKFEKAALENNISQLAIAGGVSANSGLRSALINLCQHNDWQHFIPKIDYCTDNAAMIAINAHFKYRVGDFSDHSVRPSARLAF